MFVLITGVFSFDNLFFRSNFTWFNNYLYGNCFTFNSNNVNGDLTISKAGPMYGEFGAVVVTDLHSFV